MLKGGVPQGTKLGPVGFQIFVNDAADNANCKYFKYVDDLTFAENRNISRRSLIQDDLDDLVDWSNINHVKPNPLKCQAMQVCLRNSPPQVCDLTIEGEPVTFVHEAKILDLWLQNNLKWSSHIEHTLEKANKKLFMLRTLKKFGFSSEELCIVYKGYVRPILEYADVVWHSGITIKQTKEFEQVQKRACRIIQGNKYTSYPNALAVFKLDSLADRRKEHCVKFAQGLVNNVHTITIMPPTREACHGRMLRNNHHFSSLPSRTSRYYNSPIPFFTRICNDV